MSELAPIIVFAYNRPWHVEQTLTALMNNVLADQSVLYIYCDGAKDDATESQKQKVTEVRQVIKKKQWCKNVFIIESDRNKGLANSVIGGVTDVINRYGKVIVLEDDLITSPYFLKYMNDALTFYTSYSSVFSISADRPYRMSIPDDYQYDVFASLRFFSYGWATWKSKWNKVDWNMPYYKEHMNSPYQISAFNRQGEDMSDMLKMQYEGKIDSWAVRFAYYHYQNHAVSIMPCRSYIKNLGLDGSGIHCGVVVNNNDINKAIIAPRFVSVVYEDARIINSFYNTYCRRKRPLWQKMVNFVSKKIVNRPVFLIKRKVYNI